MMGPQDNHNRHLEGITKHCYPCGASPMQRLLFFQA